ncbi:hypothetical protein [Cyanobium gracile]|uniref:Uncharacterized protein n=1 Tax=Cyanobium gracile (strain ATCC 27147 / PCC 6307) TaxID=292564 RepID=K9P850_CYAGP|nr:hypothetical protein [Cyanobium gracile]AFY29148.1 hypothetical protein Cyagr_2025 [Cyanobium gracile PCC 6307]
MRRLPLLAASLLGLACVVAAAPALADTVQARCDVFPAGEDKATSSGLCSFSQRQGFVSIQLMGGERIELKPNESTPNAYFDGRGEPARREILEANRGQVYRLENQSIFVFWDPAPYGKEATGSTTPTAPSEKPPEIVQLLLGIRQVKFEGACRVNFNKAGKLFSKTSACTPAQVSVAEDAMQRFFREQGL